MATTTLVVSRTSGRDIKMRGLEVLLDGKFVKDLSFGKSLTLEVAAGDHELEVTNRLYSQKRTIAFADGEIVRVQVGNFVTGFGALMMGVLGVGPYKVFIEDPVHAPA